MNLLISIGVLLAACSIPFLPMYIVLKAILKRELPSNNYTPFDYIIAQSPVEFHDEKQEKEEHEEQGDDNEKNKKLLPKRTSHP